jgi:hypothetical protein
MCIELPINVGSNHNTHTLWFNVDGDNVSVRKNESVFGWHGNQSYTDTVGRTNKKDLLEFCKKVVAEFDDISKENEKVVDKEKVS